MTLHLPFIAGRWEFDGRHIVHASVTQETHHDKDSEIEEHHVPPPDDPADGLRPVGIYGVLSL
jgi:hypothetical protein